MRRWRVGTFSMGILLMFVGVLLLAGQIKGISSVELIFRWWPLILIVLGAEVLAHIYFSKEEQPKVKYDSFSIFMIILIVIMSTGAYAAGYLIDNVPGVKDLSAFGIYRNESRYTKNVNIKPEGENKLYVKNLNGNVRVEQSSGSEIEVNAEIDIRNNDEELAKNVSNTLIDIAKGNGINVITKPYNQNGVGKIQDIRVDYTVKVPKGIEVKVENQQGTVDIAGVDKNVDVKCNNGSVTVENLGGDLNVNSSQGRVSVNSIKGALTIKNYSGDIDVKNISGSVNIVNEFGRVEVLEAFKQISIKNVNGEIIVENSKVIEQGLNIDCRSGNINLSFPKIQQARYKVSTLNGSINTKIFKNIAKEEQKQNVEETIGGGSVEITVKTTFGDINIQ